MDRTERASRSMTSLPELFDFFKGRSTSPDSPSPGADAKKIISIVRIIILNQTHSLATANCQLVSSGNERTILHDDISPNDSRSSTVTNKEDLVRFVVKIDERPELLIPITSHKLYQIIITGTELELSTSSSLNLTSSR